MQYEDPNFAQLTQEQINAVASKLLGLDDSAFWGELDKQSLLLEFSGKSKRAFEALTPVWDLRPDAVAKGGWHEEFEYDGLWLYLADRDTFLRHSMHAQAYEFYDRAEKDRSDAHRIARVAGQWKAGMAITPGLFSYDSKWGLIKMDGHHRVAVALLSRAPVIPLYSKNKISLSGFREADDIELKESRWSPMPIPPSP